MNEDEKKIIVDFLTEERIKNKKYLDQWANDLAQALISGEYKQAVNLIPGFKGYYERDFGISMFMLIDTEDGYR